MATTARKSGRGWAYTGAVLGGLVSIAANVAHSFIPPKDTPVGAEWAPEIGAIVGAIVWPVFLFIAVEILARVTWPSGKAWQLLRWGGMLPVALVAALVSYRHLSSLLTHYGEEQIVSILGPLAVDGLMVMATGALLATGRHTPPTTASDTALHGSPAVPAPIEPTPTLDTTPAPAASPSTVDENPPDAQPTRPEPTPVPARPQVPSPAAVAARITPTRTTPADDPATVPPRKPSPRPRPSTRTTPAPELAPSAPDTPVTGPDRAQLVLPIVAADLLARAGQVASAYRDEHGTPITAGQLAVRLKVTSDLAGQALAQLDLLPNSPTAQIPTVNGHPVKAAR